MNDQGLGALNECVQALPRLQRHMIKHNTTLRVARPTDKLDEVIRFYRDGLGLNVVGSFEDHDGFTGVMLGIAGAPYHLEFTHKSGENVGRAPTHDNLLVFYLPDEGEWRAVNERLARAGYESVPSFNPFWDVDGKTYEDPDGYRVVLQRAEWPS